MDHPYIVLFRPFNVISTLPRYLSICFQVSPGWLGDAQWERQWPLPHDAAQIPHVGVAIPGAASSTLPTENGDFTWVAAAQVEMQLLYEQAFKNRARQVGVRKGNSGKAAPDRVGIAPAPARVGDEGGSRACFRGAQRD